VDLDYMPQMVSDSMRSGNVLVNPRLTTAADIERIISNAWHGIHS
jgi:alcohol dehydrogenase